MDNISKERIDFLRESKNFVKPILQMLQDNGGELSGFSQIDKLMPQYTDVTDTDMNYFKISDKGNKYTPYHFGRNFAVKNLEIAGFLTYSRNTPIVLAQKGIDADVTSLNIEKDIYDLTKSYWDKKHEEAKQRKLNSNYINVIQDNKDTIEPVYQDDQEWRDYILNKVKTLDPYKFESFCRGLLNKMGFEIDSVKGIKKSGDNGIDGFAYCIDKQSLKTTRVAIQCKRFIDNPVGSPDIINLRGTLPTHQAEYGIMITTSYFTNDAIKVSREGNMPITLIDGAELVNLMVEHKYKVRETLIYIPDEEYFNA